MRIAVVSDLHAGRLDEAVAAALVADLAAVAPDAVVVAGDLTQRARRRQFARAAELVGALGPVVLVLPGNHDLPLWDVPRRLAAPRARFRAVAGDPPASPLILDEVALLGVDTTRRRRAVGGVVEARDRSRIAALGAVPARIRILVTHHPVVAHAAGHELVRGAEAAAAAAAIGGIDVLVAGHHHDPWVAEVALPGRNAIAVHTGTAASTRHRAGHPNAYAVLDVDAPGTIVATTRSYGREGFHGDEAARFEHVAGGWRRV